ncbi:unnamed protein product [Paramecium sonneborni]|uniref:Uncharacterized protein n=1 Tax=Paramecium sonneborni TaxID=65129 RepID=A0A8S1N2N2_9CILI|nr:unnamed protein product [Paramecium sonneborni]
MSKEWTIYKICGNSFKIICEENKKEKIQIKFDLMDQPLDCQRIGNPEQNSYIMYSIFMLKNQQKATQMKDQQIQELKTMIIEKDQQIEKKIEEYQKMKNCEIQFQAKNQTILGLEEEIKGLDKQLKQEKSMNGDVKVNTKFKEQIEQYQIKIENKNQEISKSRKLLDQLSKVNDQLSKDLDQKSKMLEQKIQELEQLSQQNQIVSQKTQLFIKKVQTQDNDINEENNKLRQEIQNLILKHERNLHAALENQKKQLEQWLQQTIIIRKFS